MQAASRIAPCLHETPVLTSRSIDQLVGAPVYFKCEMFQRTGSFKARGALNAVGQTGAEVVATHSSGNHGAALAYAAREAGKQAIVVVPDDASAAKVANIERYEAETVGCGPTQDDRESTLAEVVRRTGAEVVHPYDDYRVIAGQGTVMLELSRQVPSIAEVWLPVGGGGLASGCVVAAPDGVRVVGAEPELAGDAALGLELGERQPQMPPRTVADGLRAALGRRNFGILQSYGLDIHLVSESEIIDAQQLLMSCLKVIVEPSSAVPFAALLKTPSDRPVGVVLTGGNWRADGY